jgi:proteasome lid subunit RPN8/RPN11
MLITDLALADIRTHIASHEPERGGALYGPKNQNLVTHFEYDLDGETSAVSYLPSRTLINNVKTVEIETGLKLKGIVHSHPRGFARPSQGDIRTVQSFFRLNPHLSKMELPIVQPIGSNAPAGTSDFITWFNAERGNEVAMSSDMAYARNHRVPQINIVNDDLFVIPLLKDVNQLAISLGSHRLIVRVDTKVQHLRIQNASLIGLVAKCDNSQDFMFFVGMDYPIIAPLVLFQARGQTCQLEFKWKGLENRQQALDNIADALKCQLLKDAKFSGSSN